LEILLAFQDPLNLFGNKCSACALCESGCRDCRFWSFVVLHCRVASFGEKEFVGVVLEVGWSPGIQRRVKEGDVAGSSAVWGIRSHTWYHVGALLIL
jgi:hypothetical protein